jgi:gamma-glutamyltranspeptidase/glutathione hydrolase
MKSLPAVLALACFVSSGRAARAQPEIAWQASGTGGAVAAGGAQAVAAGVNCLRAGGNAADAAASTLFALAVTDYGAFAIGGECALLIYDARRNEVKSLAGIGGAPLDPKAIEWYYANGIPHTGSMRAAPVPGAVDLCVTLLRLYGTKTLAETLAPTLALLDAGNQSWHPALAVTLRKLVEAEAKAPGGRAEKLIAARDRFYKGDIADELEAWYIETGSFLRKTDLAAHQTLVEDPVTVEYRGYTVCKCGPWTQGPVLCQSLALLSGFELARLEHGSADHIHLTVEAMKLAYADRDEYFGDPRFANVPMSDLLSEKYTKLRRTLINPSRAAEARRPGDPRAGRGLKQAAFLRGRPPLVPVQDTTTCVVADGMGNVVAATPSCNLLTNQPGPSGVTQGNRLRSLNTAAGHPNCIEPGKRPRITLTPTILLKGNRAVAAISVAGGDLQDQTTLNVLINHVDFGMPPELAVTAPRFHMSHYQDSFNPNPNRALTFVDGTALGVAAGVTSGARARLAERGHRIREVSGPIGHPVMLSIDPQTRLIRAAGDPAARRHAAAIE